MKKWIDPNIVIIIIIALILLGSEMYLASPHSIKDSLQRGEPVNILLLGIDSGQDKMDTRSDTIILANVNSRLNKVVLLWIPRDTRINTANKSKKINMVHQLQGPKASCKEVGKLMSAHVEYYVVTNFSGFEKIIDLLDGVYMDVDINLSSPDSGVYLHKGYKRLSGKEALKYARYRGVQDGDIGRTRRQQKLLQALSKQLLQKDTIAVIPELFAELRNNVETNLNFADMLYLANLALDIGENNIITQTLPGQPYIDPYSGASYWLVKPEVCRNIINSLYSGRHFEVTT